jgi:hypothetical protein
MSNKIDKLKDVKIIPDIIDDCNPIIELHIEYLGGNKVFDGNILPPSVCQAPPKITLSSKDSNFIGHKNLVTLIMVDPDSPTKKNPAFREWRNWVKVNIPVKFPSNGELLDDISQFGDTLSTYQGIDPAQDSGTHRYTFLLFKQSERITNEPLNDIGNHRANFKTLQFAKEKKLGKPIGCSFFLSMNEDKIKVVRNDMERILSNENYEIGEPNEIMDFH